MNEASTIRNDAEVISRLSFDINRDQQKILDFFVSMLKINSVNPRMGGPGETERANLIHSFLKSEGFMVLSVNVPDENFKGRSRPNISAKIEGIDKSRTLWYLSHMDTVPEGSRELWKTDPFDPVVKDGKVFARGAVDNGQSLVSTLFALRELKLLKEKLPFNVGIWAVSDEEYGSAYGVKYLLENGFFKPKDLIVVPDAGTPEGTAIEIAEKNLLWLKFTTKGKQVHASLPSKGKNAHRIGMELSMKLDRILHEKYTKRDYLFDETSSTFEPTKIEPSVPNINTVPGIDVFYFDCRVLPEYSLDDVLSDIKNAIKESELARGTEITLQIINREDAGPATQPSSDVAQLMAKAILSVRKEDAKFVGIGGQTVGNLFRKKGLPTAVWSTVDEVPHEPNEYSRIENLISDTKVFTAMPLLRTTD